MLRAAPAERRLAAVPRDDPRAVVRRTARPRRARRCATPSSRRPTTRATARRASGRLRENSKLLLDHADPRRPPTRFTVALERDMEIKGGRGRGSFVQALESLTEDFYQNVVQDLKAWVEPPPRLDDSESEHEPAPEHIEPEAAPDEPTARPDTATDACSPAPQGDRSIAGRQPAASGDGPPPTLHPQDAPPDSRPPPAAIRSPLHQPHAPRSPAWPCPPSPATHASARSAS